MDGDAIDLGEAFFDAVFNGGGDVVDLSDGEIAVHGAMTGDEDFVFDGADVSVVAIDKFMKFGGEAADEIADVNRELLHFFAAGDVRAERLNVDDDRGVVIGFAEQVVFEFGGEMMGFAKAGVLVDFEMKLDEQAAVDLMRG